MVSDPLNEISRFIAYIIAHGFCWQTRFFPCFNYCDTIYFTTYQCIHCFDTVITRIAL